MKPNVNDYAIVVGVSHYLELPKLLGPENDAEKIYNWLISKTGGNVPKKNCYLIKSSENPLLPVQDSIDDCFGEILSSLNNQDNEGRRLYFYFSGHGLGIEFNDTALILPKWSDTLRNYALSSSEYYKTLIQSGLFQELFFFLDCCRNRIVGTKGALPYFGNPKPSSATGTCNAYVFWASEFDNKAYEAFIQPEEGKKLDNNRTRGLFTISLLKGLEGAAAKKGILTVGNLIEHLEKDLPKLAEKVNKIQNPKFKADTDGKDVIILNNVKQKSVILKINFSKNGKNVFFENSDLEIIKQGKSNGSIWELNLKKGLYSLYYEGEEENAKSIKIDGTKNPYNYEY